MRYQRRNKIKFDTNQITKLHIICENGIVFNITPHNIKTLLIFYPYAHMNNIQIQHYAQQEISTDISLQNVELILKLKRKANTIYHGYDNFTCKKTVFERLEQKDITQIEVWCYDEQDNHQSHYSLSLVYSDSEWYQGNQYQINEANQDGSLTINIRLEEE